MPDIFLSYAREDLASAQRIAETIEGFGWSVFWDREIPHGEDYRTYIGRQLSTARCVVVLWSEASINSSWVLDEAGEGLERQRLVPVFVERVRAPFGFRQLQTADLTQDAGADRERELGRLRDSITAKIQFQDASPQPRIISREPSAAAPVRDGRTHTPVSVPREAIAAATLVTLLGGLAAPLASHAGHDRALLLWVMTSICAGLIIGRSGSGTNLIYRAALVPGVGHTAGALGTYFFHWTASQLATSKSVSLTIPLGGSGGVIDLGNPMTVAVMLALSAATGIVSWVVISATAISADFLMSALLQNYEFDRTRVDRLRRWLIVITAATAAAIGVLSGLGR